LFIIFPLFSTYFFVLHLTEDVHELFPVKVLQQLEQLFFRDGKKIQNIFIRRWGEVGGWNMAFYLIKKKN